MSPPPWPSSAPLFTPKWFSGALGGWSEESLPVPRSCLLWWSGGGSLMLRALLLLDMLLPSPFCCKVMILIIWYMRILLCCFVCLMIDKGREIQGGCVKDVMLLRWRGVVFLFVWYDNWSVMVSYGHTHTHTLTSMVDKGKVCLSLRSSIKRGIFWPVNISKTLLTKLYY